MSFDLATWKNQLENPKETIHQIRTGIQGGAVQGRWLAITVQNPAPFAFTTPSTAVALSRSTAGAMGQANASTGSRYVNKIRPSWHDSSLAPASPLPTVCTWALVDRLSHQGGLDGTVTTAQTTNLPTAALTRHTNGERVIAALEVFSQLGTSEVSASVSYTNSDGTSGRSGVVGLGSTNGAGRNIGRILVVPNQEGDIGVRSVESVTLSGSTGAAGNFGVVLFKPRLPIFAVQMGDDRTIDTLFDLGAQVQALEPDACLQWFITSSGGTGQAITYSVSFADG